MEDFPGGPILKPPGIAPVMKEMKRLCLGVGLILGMEFHQSLYFGVFFFFLFFSFCITKIKKKIKI